MPLPAPVAIATLSWSRMGFPPFPSLLGFETQLLSNRLPVKVHVAPSGSYRPQPERS
jgi:hypothetical protein